MDTGHTLAFSLVHPGEWVLCSTQQGTESQKKRSLVGFSATNVAVINLLTPLTRCSLCFQIRFHSTFLGFRRQLENGNLLSKVKISLSKCSPKFNSRQ